MIELSLSIFHPFTVNLIVTVYGFVVNFPSLFLVTWRLIVDVV